VQQPRVAIGGDALSGKIPKNVRSRRALSPYPSSSVSHRFSIQSPALKHIDIAECDGVSKVELDGIVAAIEWCTWVWPQGGMVTGARERTGRRRGIDGRSMHGEAGGRGDRRYD
jgi:hypothetical protein